MLHQYQLESNTEFTNRDIGDICNYTPSESGSDAGEKSVDSGYKGSIGRSRSESYSMNADTKMPGSGTWQDSVEHRSAEAASSQHKYNNIEERSTTFDKVVLCEDHNEPISNDFNMDCDNKRRLSSCIKPDSNTNRKASLKKVKRVKSYIFSSVRTFVICLSLLQLFQVMGSG